MLSNAKRDTTQVAGYLQSWKRTTDDLARWLGIDRAVAAIVAVRGWQLLAGPITIFFIMKRLSSEQQGFYYTFGSVLALQSLAELGLSFVLGQFASHEFIRLRWAAKGTVEGDPGALQRFRDLLLKSMAWYGVIAALVIAVLVPIGLLFFGQKDPGGLSIGWRLPWILVVTATAMSTVLMPLFAIVEGSGEVVRINAVRLMQNVSGSISVWGVLFLGGGLLAVPASAFSAVAVGLYWILREKSGLLKQCLADRSRRVPEPGSLPPLSWRGEVWPMQWRFGITVISGYFTYQLLTPVLFYYHGAVVAGQMGMTMTVVNAVYLVALSWINARVPRFGSLIARRDWKGLDALFARVFKQSLGVVTAGAFGSAVLIWLLHRYFSIGQRFLPVLQVALLLGAAVVDLVINALAAYLRAHKREPLMWLSLGAAFLRGLATWQLGMRFSSLGIAAGTLAVNAVYALPVTLWIWLSFRSKWHAT